MEALSELLALCEGNPPVTGGFTSQKASSTGFDIYFNVSLNKLLKNQLNIQWFDTSWRSCDITVMHMINGGEVTLKDVNEIEWFQATKNITKSERCAYVLGCTACAVV